MLIGDTFIFKVYLSNQQKNTKIIGLKSAACLEMEGRNYGGFVGRAS